MAGRTLARAWQRHSAAQDDPRLGTSFAAGLGFTVALVGAAVMTHLRTQLSPVVAVGIFLAVVVLAGWWMTWFGALVTAGLAFLMLNGFVIDRYAVLRWHGGADAVRLIVLVGFAMGTAAARELQLRHRRRSSGAEIDRELVEITKAPPLSRRGPRHA